MPAASVPQVAVNEATLAALEDLDTQLNLLWRRARAINFQLTRSVHPDLEPAAYGLLSVLPNQGGMRLTEPASRVGVGKPSVSRQITLLASLGLVCREGDSADRRAQLIELTAAGREGWSQFMPAGGQLLTRGCRIGMRMKWHHLRRWRPSSTPPTSANHP